MSNYKRLTNEELEDYVSRVLVQLEPTLSQQTVSIIQEVLEYRTKIDNGTLIDINDVWYEYEEIKDKKRYIICQHYLTKMIVDFADNKAEAEKKLEEMINENK